MDTFVTLLEQTLASPWIYGLIALAVAVDSTIPAVPAETLVITAGAYAARGDPDPTLLVTVAAIGAVFGDHLTHQLGRSTGRLSRWLRRRSLGDSVLRWASKGLHERGGVLIIGARFIPGGRTATTFTSGVVGYPRVRFALFASIAGLAWAVYTAAVGYAGGVVFHQQPLIGVAVGIGLALVVGCAVELVRHLRRRRTARITAEESGAGERTEEDECAPRW